ncbi:restriction endonuclease subunit S [Halopseudomonas pachastrellae]|nr:restriction endonuclease subunit S [Halopseudomonas pachastrellae]
MLAPSVKLGEVIDLIGGGTPSKSNESFYNGDIPWATVRDMKQEQLCSTEFQISEEAVRKSSTNIIEAGNIITATRVGLGKVCILQQDTAINQDLKALIPKDSRLDKQYLFWWLKSVAHVIEAAGTGATVKGAVAGAECNTVIELKPEHHAALPWHFA